MPATKRDRTGLSEIIVAHTERLRLLQVQAARQGNDTPPHIIAEIEQIDAELAQIKAAAATPVSDALIEELGPTGRYQLWMAHIMRLDSDIGYVRRELQALHDKFDQLLLALAVEPRRQRRKAE
jgi:hypothetical protein